MNYDENFLIIPAHVQAYTVTGCCSLVTVWREVSPAGNWNCSECGSADCPHILAVKKLQLKLASVRNANEAQREQELASEPVQPKRGAL